jgi:hypothetical protein
MRAPFFGGGLELKTVRSPNLIIIKYVMDRPENHAFGINRQPPTVDRQVFILTIPYENTPPPLCLPFHTDVRRKNPALPEAG